MVTKLLLLILIELNFLSNYRKLL